MAGLVLLDRARLRCLGGARQDGGDSFSESSLPSRATDSAWSRRSSESIPVITTLTGSERSYAGIPGGRRAGLEMNGSPIGFIANAPMPSRTSLGKHLLLEAVEVRVITLSGIWTASK